MPNAIEITMKYVWSIKFRTHLDRNLLQTLNIFRYGLKLRRIRPQSLHIFRVLDLFESCVQMCLRSLATCSEFSPLYFSLKKKWHEMNITKVPKDTKYMSIGCTSNITRGRRVLLVTFKIELFHLPDTTTIGVD